MTTDRSVLSRSRLHLQILEMLFDAAQNQRESKRWIGHHDIRERLIAEHGYGTCRRLRELVFDGVLAVLEECGCVRRNGWAYLFLRCLRHDDFAPVVSDSPTELHEEPA